MSEQDAGSQNGSSDSSSDSLNGSWVKLDASYKSGNERPFSIHNGEMENLLAEAVAEERAIQRPSLPSTPTDECSPVESKPGTEARVLPPETVINDPDWIENWASRVEPHPPKKWRLTYPPQKRNEKNKNTSMADRKTDYFQVNFYIVIPTILLTHIVAFGIGFYIGRRSSTATVAV